VSDPAVELDGESLTVEEVVAVARAESEARPEGGAPEGSASVRASGEAASQGAPRRGERRSREPAAVTVPEAARERVRESRERVESVLDSGDAVYGVNTGFGELVDERIPPDEVEQLQTNLVRSHAAGAGRELAREEVRALMATRVNALVKGFSGVREAVVDHLVAMLNEGVHPVVKSRGSLGASGDLAPLAHVALVLVGEGEADVDADGGIERLPGDEALAAAGLAPLALQAKEGLALINGTQLTVGIGALVVHDAERAVRAADAAGALTAEVTMSTTANCDPAIQAVRPHHGQAASARNVKRLTADSEIVESHRNCDRVQDAYSVRCLPQVHGAVRDAVAHLRDAVEVELNAATDNPLVFPAGDVDDRASGTGDAAVLSGGNFHGAPLAHRLDYLVGALADLAAISERRVDRVLNPNVQEPHLPPFLAGEPGLESGYMLAQYTAAALVDECRALGRPATDNVPVSGNQEDHVSMSVQSAFDAETAVENALAVVGIELLCASEAIEYVDDGLEPGVGTGAAYEAVREVVPPLEGDRPIHEDVERVEALVAGGLLEARVMEALDGDLE
jgi:histidine ammonia-lyase